MVPGNVIVVVVVAKRGLGLRAAAMEAAAMEVVAMVVVCMEVRSAKETVVEAEEEEAAVVVAMGVAR